jgi:hypothetical protein
MYFFYDKWDLQIIVDSKFEEYLSHLEEKNEIIGNK